MKLMVGTYDILDNRTFPFLYIIFGTFSLKHTLLSFAQFPMTLKHRLKKEYCNLRVFVHEK